MKIEEYLRPKSIEEAYELLINKEGSLLIGGGAFLRLSNRQVKLGIDLIDANLNYIRETETEIEIGAMTTYREIEQSEVINKYFNGVISKAVKKIMGVQIRNIATVGGSIAGKYGFSDFIAPLLVVDCEVVLHKWGRLPLADYLNYKEKDIIEKLIIKKSDARATYKDFRHTATDFPVLNASASLIEGKYKIAIGARPGTAVIVKELDELIMGRELNKDIIEEISIEIATKMKLGTDMRATEEYRRELCKVLVKRALTEVRG